MIADIEKYESLNLDVAYMIGMELPEFSSDDDVVPLKRSLVKENGEEITLLASFIDSTLSYIFVMITDDREWNASRGPQKIENICAMFAPHGRFIDLVRPYFKKLQRYMRKSEESYTGVCQIKCVLGEESIFFYGITFYPEEYVKDMVDLVEGFPGSIAVKLSVSRDPGEGDVHVLAGRTGMGYYLVAQGESISEAWNNMYEYAHALPPEVYFRTDGKRATKETFYRVTSWINSIEAFNKYNKKIR